MERIEDVCPEWTCVNAELFARVTTLSWLTPPSVLSFLLYSKSIEACSSDRESKFPPPHLFVWSSGNLQGRRTEGSADQD